MRSILLVSLIGALIVSGYFNLQLIQEKQNSTIKLEEQSNRLKKLEADLAKARAHLKSDLDAQRQVVDDLKASLKSEQDTLAILEQRRNTARNGGVGGDDPSYYNAPIQKENDAIADLRAQIQQIEGQKKSLKSSQNQALGATKQQQTASLQQMDNAIAAGRENLASLQGQLKAMKPGIFDVQTKAQIQPLKSQIADQKNQLQSLQSQRSAIVRQGQYQMGDINGQAGAQAGNLSSDESQLNQRLQAEKSALEQLKRQQKAATRSRSDQKSAIAQDEKDYQTERQKVQELQAQLKEAEARLQELTI